MTNCSPFFSPRSSPTAASSKSLQDEALQSKLERIARHRTRIERSYFKSLKELSRIQTERVLTRCTEKSSDYTDVSPPLNTAEFRRRRSALQNFKTNPTWPIPARPFAATTAKPPR